MIQGRTLELQRCNIYSSATEGNSNQQILFDVSDGGLSVPVSVKSIVTKLNRAEQTQA